MAKNNNPHDSSAINELLAIMVRLRDPQHGCPWDLEQDFASVIPYTLEEAYEVAEAVRLNDAGELCDELGDLLFQVVFHAQMANELGWFGFADVVEAINSKLVRRHPHVFGDETVADASAQSEAWELHKAGERAAKGASTGSALDGVPLALPALVRAQKIQHRAARTGFDWDAIEGVVAKLDEELAELKAALAARESIERVQEELGDLMFSGVNLARWLDADAETLLRDASSKFETRFRQVEALAKQEQRELCDCSLQQLESYWQTAKQHPGD